MPRLLARSKAAVVPRNGGLGVVRLVPCHIDSVSYARHYICCISFGPGRKFPCPAPVLVLLDGPPVLLLLQAWEEGSKRREQQ